MILDTVTDLKYNNIIIMSFSSGQTLLHNCTVAVFGYDCGLVQEERCTPASSALCISGGMRHRQEGLQQLYSFYLYLYFVLSAFSLGAQNSLQQQLQTC